MLVRRLADGENAGLRFQTGIGSLFGEEAGVVEQTGIEFIDSLDANSDRGDQASRRLQNPRYRNASL